MRIEFPLPQGILNVEYIKKEEGFPTIIFLHDALGSVQTWKNFPQHLAEITQCNYLVYDRLGHGNSSALSKKRSLDYLEREAEILLKLIKDLNIKNVILFGHSDGGSIGLIAASKSNPSNLLGLITEAAHVFVEDITLQGIKTAKNYYFKGNLKEKLERYHGSKTDALFHAWADTWLEDRFRDWNIESLLHEITCPCLILQGEKDAYGSIMQVEQIKKGIGANASIKLLPDIGHTPHKEHAELISRITSKFIDNLI